MPYQEASDSWLLLRLNTDSLGAIPHSCDFLYFNQKALALLLRSQIWGQPRGETPPDEEVITRSDDQQSQHQFHTVKQSEEEKNR